MNIKYLTHLIYY